MEYKLEYDLWNNVLFLAIIGLLEAYFRSQFILHGAVVGGLLGLLSIVGIVPVLGQILYYAIGKTIMFELHVSLPMTFVMGFVFSVIVSIVVVGFFATLKVVFKG